MFRFLLTFSYWWFFRYGFLYWLQFRRAMYFRDFLDLTNAFNIGLIFGLEWVWNFQVFDDWIKNIWKFLNFSFDYFDNFVIFDLFPQKFEEFIDLLRKANFRWLFRKFSTKFSFRFVPFQSRVFIQIISQG